MSGRSLTSLFALLLAGTIAGPAVSFASGSESSAVRIEVVDRGIIEPAGLRFRDDRTSSIGAKRGSAAAMRVVKSTTRIPLVQGVTYGIAFRVTRAPTAEVTLKIVIDTSAPCRLKGSGKVTRRHESDLLVRVGDLRHIAARVPANADENPCLDPPAPGLDTISIFHAGRRIAREAFTVARIETASSR